MIFDNIESLLKENKLDEALLLISSELNKPYDFSIPEENKLFVDLKDKFQMIEKDYLTNLIDQQKNKSATRSSRIVASSIPNANHVNRDNYFIEALKNIKVERSSFNFLPKAEAYILIIMNNDIDPSLKNKFGLSDDLIEHTEPGTYYSTLGQNSEMFFSLFAVLNNKNNNPLQVLDGFSKLIESLYDQKVTDAKIFFLLKNEKQSQSIQKIIMGYTIWQLLYLIAFHSNSDFEPIFTFLFNDEINKKGFERTVLRLSSPELNKYPISSFSPERVDQIARQALTQDDAYIKQLSSIARIMDEEDIPLLISGESGVGKSYLAKIIHDQSIRGTNLFQEINCGRLSIQKIEQDLFGWRKGSFTDAKYDKKGKVTLAENGTLFLDEIDRTDSSIRNSLLTFLENKLYTILGEEEERIGDVKLIFGTNKDLKKQISKGKFEEDFYYRISERIISIPPLRNRINDIEVIADYVLNELSIKKDYRILIDKNAIELLKTYSWPGNTRELVRYLRLRFFDCLAEGKNGITAQMINEAPFENLSSVDEEDLDAMIELIKKFLDNWDISKGDFLHKFIAPVAAKLYVDDTFLQMKRTDKFMQAIKILGINGNAFKKSDLQSFYDDFNKLRALLDLE